MEKYDKIILGAGLYGLYSALYCGKRNQNILVLEYEPEPFSRATYVNQARVHQGYHYPRSLSTAMKSAEYFERFVKEFSFCINKKFLQIYATSTNFSWTNAEQFKDFCKAANIYCEELNPNLYFKNNMCSGAFLTREYTYDAIILRNYFLKEIASLKNVSIKYNSRITHIDKQSDKYELKDACGKTFQTSFLINATYASSNQILELLGYEQLKIKYELCEIILCNVNDKLCGYGITVMDGPFFSIMPFGKTGLHSLTSVTFTPHVTCYNAFPTFDCQEKSNGFCNLKHLGNCNKCIAKPKTAFPYMANLAQKYIQDSYVFNYNSSFYSMKPILLNSEIDDSRPTVIKKYSNEPTFISILSGKINTVYDLDEVLYDGK